MPLKPPDDCCSFCSSNPLFFEIPQEEASVNPPVPFRNVDEEMEILVKELLIQFRTASFDSNIFTSLELASGLPDTVIDDILSHLPYINSLKYLEDNILIADLRVMEEVLVIIQEVFEDFEFSPRLCSENSTEVNDRVVYTSESDYTSECDSDVYTTLSFTSVEFLSCIHIRIRLYF